MNDAERAAIISRQQARATMRAIGYAYDAADAARSAGAARWRLWVEHELASPSP